MASSIIHLAVAKEIARKLNINDDNLLIGSIAPDISKLLGESKIKSHYLTYDESIPDIELFLKENKRYLNNPFELGYFIHLYTDKMWFKGFSPKYICNNSLKLKDGTVIPVTEDSFANIIYNDYSNINSEIIDKYKLDLKIFYEEPNISKTYIDGYPISKIKILTDKMGNIIYNSSNKPTYVLDLNEITEFIDKCVIEILDKIKKLDIF